MRRFLLTAVLILTVFFGTKAQYIYRGPLNHEHISVLHLPDTLEADAYMNIYSGIKGQKPTEGYPVYLYLHGSGPREIEWKTGLKLANTFDDAPSLYIIPEIPHEGELYRWWQKGKIWAWNALLREILQSPDMDPSRIYLLGISEGGYGSQRLASYFPDYFAAAGPMAGGEPLKNAPVENLGEIGFSFVTGEADRMFFRNMLTWRTGEKLDSMQRLYPKEYVHRVILEKGKGHQVDYRVTTPWLKTFRRNAQPRHFIWENFEMDGIKRNACYNLQVLSEDNGTRTRYEFTAHGDTIDILANHITYKPVWKDPYWHIDMIFDTELSTAEHGSLRVFLSDSLVNLKHKILIRVNGGKAWSGLLQESAESHKLAKKLWGDPLRDFPTNTVIKW